MIAVAGSWKVKDQGSGWSSEKPAKIEIAAGYLILK
jgi:hypothetical protein